jgi:hypothetical protein
LLLIDFHLFWVKRWVINSSSTGYLPAWPGHLILLWSMVQLARWCWKLTNYTKPLPCQIDRFAGKTKLCLAHRTIFS